LLKVAASNLCGQLAGGPHLAFEMWETRNPSSLLIVQVSAAN
jgi:hypothetical protein